MDKFDVTTLGELLIDFTQNGQSKQGNPWLEANLGGAPCNLLAMLSKLVHKGRDEEKGTVEQYPDWDDEWE